MEAKNAQPNFTRGHLLAQEKSQMYTSRVEKEVTFGMEIPFNCSLHFDCQSVNEAGKKNPGWNVWQIRGCWVF